MLSIWYRPRRENQRYDFRNRQKIDRPLKIEVAEHRYVEIMAVSGMVKEIGETF